MERTSGQDAIYIEGSEYAKVLMKASVPHSGTSTEPSRIEERLGGRRKRQTMMWLQDELKRKSSLDCQLDHAIRCFEI